MLSQHEYRYIVQIIMSMLQGSQIPDQITQKIYTDLMQNPQVQQEIGQLIESSLSQQQRAQMGMHDNTYRQIVGSWVDHRVRQYMQMMSQQQQQSPQNFYQQPHGNQGLVNNGPTHVPGMAGNADIYGTNPPPQQEFQPSPWATPQPTPQPTQQYEGPPMMPNEPTPEPEPQPQESLDLEIGVDQEVTPRANDIKAHTYKVGSIGNQRFSVLSLSTTRSFNNELEVLKYVYRHMPLTSYQGRWAWVIEYPELIHVPTGTKKFSELKKKAQNGYESSNDWTAALAAIGNEVPRNEWRTLNNILTTEWNTRCQTYLRNANDITQTISIDEIDEDVQQLITSPQKVSMGEDPNFVRTVGSITESVVQSILVSNKLKIDDKDTLQMITETDPNLGDLLFTDKISMTKNGLTERDFGISPTTTDTNECIKNILDKHTVLRKKRSVLVTNVFSRKMGEGLFGEEPFDMNYHLKCLLRGIQPSVVTRATKGLILSPSKGPDKACVSVQMGWPMGPQGPSLDDGFMIPSDHTLGW